MVRTRAGPRDFRPQADLPFPIRLVLMWANALLPGQFADAVGAQPGAAQRVYTLGQRIEAWVAN